MNWDGLGDDDDDERFFESRERISSVAPQDFASSGSDAEDFEDSRMSFSSTVSSASSDSNHSTDSRANSSSILASYDMWMAEPGDVKERRKRLLQGMGLGSTKGMFRMASTKIARTVSKKRDNGRVPTPPVAPSRPVAPSPPVAVISAPRVVKVDSCPVKELRKDEPPSLPTHSHSPPTAKVFGRSRSDSDIDAFSATTKQRKEELIGQVSKQRLTRTSSELVVPSIGVSQYSRAVRMLSPGRAKDGSSHPNNKASHSAESSDGSFDSVFLIKNLDTGKEFIVKEYNEKGMWNKLSDVQTGKQLTMDEFEKSVGQSRLVKELMRRQNRENAQDGRKLNHNKYLTSFRSSKKKGAALFKNIKVAASSKSLLHKEHEHSSSEEQSTNKSPSQWVKARQHGKSYKEFTALHLSQEIQAHEGSIWVIRFSSDARFLASAGEDKVIHVWEVQECEISSTRPIDDLNSASSTPVHPMASIVSDRPTLSDVTPMPSKKKGKNNRKKANSIPDYVNVPETVFALSEKPVCTFQGHQDDVLDLSWSRSQVCY